jgi:hypothetical protein
MIGITNWSTCRLVASDLRHRVGRHRVGRHRVGRHRVGRHRVGRHRVGRHRVGATAEHGNKRAQAMASESKRHCTHRIIIHKTEIAFTASNPLLDRPLNNREQRIHNIPKSHQISNDLPQLRIPAPNQHRSQSTTQLVSPVERTTLSYSKFSRSQPPYRTWAV